ncbi:MAG: DUF1329 domain-containing protein [Proteobacteria bacterium]|nr:DUF1329 domain-containing protein [Pseudomonadota bacterium]
MKRNRILKYIGGSLCSLLVLFFCGATVQAVYLPKVIDKTNCAQYKDLLIPAMYRAVERGDFIITPGAINFKYKHQDSFIAAGMKNAGKFDISPDGDLVEKNTGKIPLYNIYGYPFPKIDQIDPKAGSRIISNFDYQLFRFMGTRVLQHTRWITTSGEERYVGGYDYRLYATGRPPGQEITRNTDHVKWYELLNALVPMSMKGTNTLAYIFMDARNDTNYAYVPAIRRIRQTPSTARSDPYMGSDAWLDVSYGWSGKDRSMKWKCVGEKTILVSFTSTEMIPAEELPDGRLTMKYPFTGWFFKLNYEVPGFKGAAWAPAPGVVTYVPRKVWVVEQMPKDPYYNWGLHVNYIDQETYTIWYKEIYEKSGEFRTWVTFFVHYSEAPTGKNNTGDYDSVLFVDEKIRHATISSRAPDPEVFLYMPASKLDPSFFSVSNFLLLSK